MAPMQAKVKNVLSGDTLVLQNKNDPTQERTFSLAFVSAPRIRKEGEEPFAFQSRDFLRRLCVGKVVQFNVLYQIPVGVKRDYGTVTLADGQQLPDLVVAEGWAKIRDDAGKKEDTEEGTTLLERLEALEAHAKADEKGVWGKDPKIEVVHELSDAKAFAETWKGKSIDAIVEKVLSGDRIIARLMVTPTQHTQTIVLVAGIRAPGTKRTLSDGSEQPAEPFGNEAQAFVDQRLLQRGVSVTILGVSPNNLLVGEVRHPNGSIAEFVLKAGLARCTDHHSTLLGSEMGKLRQAEKYAKDNKLALFRGHVSARHGGADEVEATVSRIFSADTLFLRNKAGGERRINLSSVRQPKPSDEKQAPFGAEAKEFLRKRLIGKHVKVTIDGKRPATEGYEEREMATITCGNKNVALLLVENGYASVIRHRMDDTDRSPIYDELLAAEESAQKEGKGMWNPKPPKKIDPTDYSENVTTAKRQLTLLSRQKKVPGVVDYVKSGSRFTVLLPRDGAKLTLVLSGIRAPRSARGPSDTAEPFGQEAHDFANRRCLQRDVEIDIEDTDKVGGFIGAMYVNRESFAKSLVEEGLASVHAYSAERSGNANELFAAETKAKEARRGMWHDWDPEKEAEKNGEAFENGAADAANGTNGEPVTNTKKEYKDVMVTHVDATGRLKLQTVGTGTAALTELMNRFKSFHLSSANNQPLPTPPKTGDVVSAKFTEDDTWYRAKIRRNDRDSKTSEVLYIDYGNSETIPWSRLRPLDGAKFGTQKLRPQANDAVLSYLQFPNTPEYLQEAAIMIGEVTGDRQLIARVDHTDQKDGTMFVTLFLDAQQKDSVNADIVGEGLAMVPRKPKPWERAGADVLAALKKREELAKEEKRGMWEYGDLSED
ncbi:hypothetical protein LTR50_002977 [Elasticomyces elasticus]|nr:hypothetical protein LTR50_002977 [Elasticomyces elasticus]